jgi:hypothetical protein
LNDSFSAVPSALETTAVLPCHRSPSPGFLAADICRKDRIVGEKDLGICGV